MSKKRNIKIETGINSSPERQLKIRENPDSYFNWRPSWNFSKCDLEHHKWSLKKSNMFSEIIPKLISFEQRNWGDIVSDKKA